MPGTFKAIYHVAFDLDKRAQAIMAFKARIAVNEISAIEVANI